VEIVIATTDAARAQWMKNHYIGHTMSGESLERRPMVQYTDAADFFDAAMRLYRITHIRLVPSSHYPALTDVIAEYERAILLCEVCGVAAGFSDLHDMKPPACVEEYHCFCSECKTSLQQKLTAEIEEERQRLGDPIDACIGFLLQQKRPVLPHRLARLLTGKELHEVGRQAWARARKDFLTMLIQRIGNVGMRDLDAISLAPHVSPLPHWKQGEEHLEYKQGESLLGYVARQEQNTPLSCRKKVIWHCFVFLPRPWIPEGRKYLETRQRLDDAKQVVESFWCRQEQREAERRRIRDNGGYSFEHSGYAFCLEYDREWYFRRHLERTASLEHDKEVLVPESGSTEE
jgi:hypothetical protein